MLLTITLVMNLTVPGKQTKLFFLVMAASGTRICCWLAKLEQIQTLKPWTGFPVVQSEVEVAVLQEEGQLCYMLSERMKMELVQEQKSKC